MANEAIRDNWATGARGVGAQRADLRCGLHPVHRSDPGRRRPWLGAAGARRRVRVGHPPRRGGSRRGRRGGCRHLAGDGRSGAPTGTRATVVIADAQTADLLAAAPGEPFDRVVSRFGVMFFVEPEAAFANIRSATAPGAASRSCAGGRTKPRCSRSASVRSWRAWPFHRPHRRPARPARWASPTPTAYSKCSALPAGRT